MLNGLVDTHSQEDNVCAEIAIIQETEMSR